MSLIDSSGRQAN